VIFYNVEAGVGCGSAYYIKYAATKNPALIAVGSCSQMLPNRPPRTLHAGNCMTGPRTEVGDIRENAFGERFDIVTLSNNIYCFPVEDRISLLRLIKKFLRPHDLLLLTTCCQGGNLGIKVLNLWGQPLKLQEDCRASMK
jgi:hypothetical protein